MALPRALWRRAPLVLLRHLPVLAAVLAASFLVALAAASAPLLRAGVESEALKGKLADLTPLGAGLTIEAHGGPAAGDAARRFAALRLARTLPHTGRAVLTSSTSALVGGKVANDGNPLEIVPMARDGATAHVRRLAGDGHGAWVAAEDAKLAGVGPGDRLQLLHGPSVRVGAIYLRLDEDLDNPYWVNFFVRIRNRNPDAPPRPSFLLVDRATLYRIAHATAQNTVENTFEFPVAGGSMTPGRARELAAAFARVHDDRSLGCPCSITSPLTAAVRLAGLSVDALTPVIALLAGFATLIGVGAAFVAGSFGVRRRAAEARLSVINGETRTAFAARAALEALVPAAFGTGAGAVTAALLVRRFTPSGTVDRSVVGRAALIAVAAGIAALVAVAVGAAAARGPLMPGAPGRRLRLPWEVPVLAAAGVLYVLVDRGGGLARNAAVGSHPRLVVLCLPLVLAAGLTGAVVQVVRRALRSVRPREAALYLAVRRLVAARSLLVLLVVTAAAASAALTFAQVLERTLTSSSREKAYVANGSDVQGLVDPLDPLPQPLPFPAARVTEDFGSARIDGSARSLELMAVRPQELERVVGHPELQRLADSRAPLPAIANRSARGARTITFGGQRLPVQVVAVVRSFPGSVAGEDLLVVPAPKLERAVAQPYEGATAYVWVRGDAAAITRALAAAEPTPAFVTTVDHFLRGADLSTAERTYGFLRAIALGAALVALVAVLLYLHARARTQLVTGELLRRMGMTRARQAAAVACEAAFVVLLAGLSGVGSALLVAAPLAARLDPLPQYAPGVALDVPWAALALTLFALVVLAALAGAMTSLATRGDVAEAVRVA